MTRFCQELFTYNTTTNYVNFRNNEIMANAHYIKKLPNKLKLYKTAASFVAFTSFLVEIVTNSTHIFALFH